MNKQIVASISPENWELVKAGKAVLGPGGVRNPDGTLVELLKPTLSKGAGKALNAVSGGVLGGLNLASSVGCNVQCAFIQKGVNQANVKLDVVIDTLNDLSNAVGKLGTIQSLSWLTSAVGITNLVVSAVGFYKMSKKLDGLDMKLNEINENIENIQRTLKKMEISSEIKDYKRLTLDLEADIEEMQRMDISYASREREIRTLLNASATLLEQFICKLGDESEFDELYCRMIFTLSALFVQAVNNYSARYYDSYHAFPTNYSKWAKIIVALNSEEFHSKVRKFIIFGMPRVPFGTRQKACDYALSLTNNQGFQFDYSYSLIPEISLYEYIHIDEYVEKRFNKTHKPVLILEDGSYAF